MKEIQLPYAIGQKDILHHEYIYNLDGTETHLYYLLNPVERIWHNVVDWIKYRIGK
jgi:hypothetical protein